MFDTRKEGICLIPLDEIKNHRSSTPPLYLEYHRIQFSIVAGKCQTTHILTFFNSTDEILEGEMLFPLPENGTIMRYGLDIDEVMVDAVPVEKEKARIVFESEARKFGKKKNVSMLEKVDSLSNVFRLRVYPLPPQKQRYVKIVVVDEMIISIGSEGKPSMTTFLSLSTSPFLKELKFRIYPPIDNSVIQVKMSDGEMEEITRKKGCKHGITTLKKPEFLTGIRISVPIPENDEGFVCIEKDPDSGYHFFSATFLNPPHAGERIRVGSSSPNDFFRVRIFYDVSHSRTNSDWRKELTFLQIFLDELESVVSCGSSASLEIIVRTFSCFVHEEKIFSSTLEVFEFLINQEKDGGTSLPIHEILSEETDPYSVTLLFTDGVLNFGNENIISILESSSPRPCDHQQRKTRHPIFCISSAMFSSSRLLRYICEESTTGGEYIDLSKIDIPMVESWTQNLIRRKWEYDVSEEVLYFRSSGKRKVLIDPEDSVKEVYCCNSSRNDSSMTTVYGILIEPSDRPTIQLDLGNNNRSKKIRIEIKEEVKEEKEENFPHLDSTSTILRTLWAQQKIDQLLIEGAKNAKIIREIGTKYNIVTPNTSLVVLSELSQFQKHKICPPRQLKSVRKEYLNQVEVEEFSESDRRKTKLEEMVKLWELKRIKWHMTDFPIIPKKRSEEEEEEIEERKKNIRSYRRANDDQVLVFVNPDDEGEEKPKIAEVPFKQFLTLGNNSIPKKWNDFIVTSIRKRNRHRRYTFERGSPNSLPPEDEENDWRQQNRNKERTSTTSSSTSTTEEENEDSILITTICDPQKKEDGQVDEEYLERIKGKETLNEKYEEYLRQKKKKKCANSPSFYLCSSDYFVSLKKNTEEEEQEEETEGEKIDEKLNNKRIGIRILTNILDIISVPTSFMSLQQQNDCNDMIIRTQLLRIVGYRLCELEMYSEASQIFERVLRERPGEPQSFRDLALSLEKLGDFRRAAELLYEVVLGKWERKYAEIELTAILELNHVVGLLRSGDKNIVNSLHIDPRLVCHNMDLDLRVCVQWDTSNTDVELHVYDPDNTHVYYGHHHTKFGGLISKDFVSGYGPEEYLQKKVKFSPVVLQQLKEAEEQEQDVPRLFKVFVLYNSQYWGRNIVSLAGGTTLYCTFFTNYMRENEKSVVFTLRLKRLKEDEEIEVCNFLFS